MEKKGKRVFLGLVLMFITLGLSAQQIEVGFAAKGTDPTAENLVLKVINSAKSEIRMEAYNFTDPGVISALIAAKKRGVDVKIVHDHVAASEKGDGTQAMRDAGIGVHLATRYKIMHNKIIIVDRLVVQTGSFNYSVNAQKENAENVLVLWVAPDMAQQYLTVWNKLWIESQ